MVLVSQFVLATGTVYQPATSPVSHVCWNEFSMSQLLVCVNTMFCTAAAVQGCAPGLSWKLTITTSVFTAPEFVGVAAALVGG